MSNYVIVTDSSADLTAELVKEMEIEVLPLTFTVQNKTFENHPDNRAMDPKKFYQLLRDGEMATTAAVNVADYTILLEPLLKNGKDVLVLAFSSGLSATFQSAHLAVEELKEAYPQRKIMAVDTLCASLGEGLLVCQAAQKQKEGKSMEEVRDWVEANKMNVCHWFTVDDLHFLKRGGRVSAATAVLGTMLSIKPVMHVDDEGKLINMEKARGRKAALSALVDKMEKSAIDPKNQTVFISHGDCIEDCQRVADEIRARLGTTKFVLNNIGPVIGTHAGPGCVALFFMGNPR